MLAYEELTGNLVAKRAIEVAAVGGFKVALVALDWEATQVIAEAASALGIGYVFVLTPCPCGNWGSPRPCNCEPEEIKAHQRSPAWKEALREADVWACVHSPDQKELREFLGGRKGESLKSVIRRVGAARPWFRERLDEISRGMTQDARKLFLKAAEEYQFSWVDVCCVLRAAEAIRALEDAPTIEVAHVSEAVEYRPQRLRGRIMP